MADSVEQQFGIDFVGNRLRIRTDSLRAADAVRFLFDPHLTAPDDNAPEITVLLEAERGGHKLALADQAAAPCLNDDDLEIALVQLAQFELVTREATRAIVHGAALVRAGRGMVLAASAGSGKTTLTSWLLGHGFGFLSDELAAIDASGAMDGFGRPLNLKPGSIEVCRQCDWLRDGFDRSRQSGNVTLLPWVRTAQADVPLAVLLFPRFQAGAAFDVELLSPGRAASGLMATLMNARNLPKHGLSLAVELVRSRPCYSVVYSDMAEVSGWLDTVWRQGF
jgi:hypothetical protein